MRETGCPKKKANRLIYLIGYKQNDNYEKPGKPGFFSLVAFCLLINKMALCLLGVD
jgi:hypothetical protein